MSKSTKPKFKVGDAVKALNHEYTPFATFDAYIGDVKQYSDGSYRYYFVQYHDDGSVGVINFDYAEKHVKRDRTRENAKDTVPLIKDLSREFHVGDAVIADMSEPRQSAFESHVSVFKRGVVKDIFLNAVGSRSIWDGVKVDVELRDTGEVKRFQLQRVQADWKNPGMTPA